MLKGLGEQLASMKYNIIDSAISVLLVYTLIPRMGVRGYIVCVFITELVNDALSLARLMTVTGVRIPVFRTVVSPLLSIVGACAATHLVMKALPFEFFHSAVEISCGISVMLLFYINFLFVFRALGREDVAWFHSIFKKKAAKT
jgi:stage V sporulation protein B